MVGNQGLLNGQGAWQPAGMIFMGDGGPEQGHDPVAPELADRALKTVDFIDQDPAAAVHDPVDVLRSSFSEMAVNPATSANMTVTSLALAFEGTAVRQDLIGQVFGV